MCPRGTRRPVLALQRADEASAARDARGPSESPRQSSRNAPAPRPTPRRICSEDIECSGLTIPKAVQYLSSQDEKYQAIGAYYIQHTCFQDESAKQQVPGRTPAHRPPPPRRPGQGLGASA